MTSKNRNMLQNFAKEREEFERQKKELELQMNKGKQNLGHIRKGMRTHEISHLKDVETDGDSIQHVKSHDRHDKSDSATTAKRRPTIHGMGKSQQSLHAHAVSAHPSSHPSQHATQKDLSKSPSFGNIYVPPCRRASDWFFTADDIASRPAGMKSQDVYHTVRFLGRGAFGSVDLVKHNDDNRLYAQKTILLENSDVDEDLLFQEVRSLRVNRHPFIISVADVYCLVSPRRLFIVLHYCEGGDLAKMITANQKTQSYFPESQVIKWMAQIALALQYLQEHHYLHRDIKPANMLMCDNGDIVKLGDFGFAVQIDENNLKSLSTAEVGTPFYTAPEMIRQEPCSFPSDNWSFGIMLYEILLLGKHPFDGATTGELVRGIMNEDPPPLPDMYSKEFVQVAQALLKKCPAERMTMFQFLTSAPLYHKVAAIPNNYKPKHHMEERFRRTQVRQLTHQLETLGISTKGSHSSQSNALHHSSSRLHSAEAPAPHIGMSGKGTMSERGMKGGEAAAADNFEETKRKLSMKYGPIETNSSDSAAEPAEKGSLPSISIRTSSAEGSRKENGGSPPTADAGGATTLLPQLGKATPPSASPNKGVLPSMHTHQEENNADVDDDKDARLPDTSPRGILSARSDSGKSISEKTGKGSLFQAPDVDGILVEETSAALAAEECDANDAQTEEPPVADQEPEEGETNVASVAVTETAAVTVSTVTIEQSGDITTVSTTTTVTAEVVESTGGGTHAM